jgi:hypothetical protein
MFHGFQQAGLRFTPSLRHTGAPTGPEQQIRTAERSEDAPGKKRSQIHRGRFMAASSTQAECGLPTGAGEIDAAGSHGAESHLTLELPWAS